MRNAHLRFAAFSFLMASWANFAGAQEFAFQQGAGFVKVQSAGHPVLTYVYQDPKIYRPYFTLLHAPGGIQVTRNMPPRTGVDPTDNPHSHTGLWMAFSDLNGHDFWHNRAIIKHVRFLEPPAASNQDLTFTVKNIFLAPGREPLGSEICRYTLSRRANGFLLVWDSTIQANRTELVFGDHAAMGLGARLHTPLTVKQGGTILSSAGRQNQTGIRGTKADWVDYSGLVGGKAAGLAILIDSSRSRPSWLDATDEGLLVANPFGQAALGGISGESVRVASGDSLRMRFGIFLHAGPGVDLPTVYQEFLGQSQ